MLIGSDNGYRRMFLGAAFYNWAVAGICGLGFQPLFPALGITPMPVPALYFLLFMAAVAVFGYMYFRVSRDLTLTVLVEMGAIAKSLVFVIVGAYWIAGVASWHLLALACVDLVYTVLFIDFLRSRKP